MYGPRGLELLRNGVPPEQALQELLKTDANFDGQGAEARQVGIVSVDGASFAYTGKEAAASGWAGSRTGKGYSIQGNGLAGPQVLEAMEQSFLNTQGYFADRLMAALSAGDHAGGQSTGKESAALLVRTPAGFPIDMDLRVDHSADPVGELGLLLNMQNARQMLVQARIAASKGDGQKAETLLIEGVSLAPMWPRIWIQGARIATTLERPDLAAQYLNLLFTMNPAWAKNEIGDGRYALIGADPVFHRWVSAAHEKEAHEEYVQIKPSTTAPVEERIDVANKLLEVGAAGEALSLLDSFRAAEPFRQKALLARVRALAATGRYTEARKSCEVTQGANVAGLPRLCAAFSGHLN